MSNLELSPSPDAMRDGEKALQANVYPGRVIVMGRSTGGLAIQAYALMGRSQPSRDRIFVQEGSSVRTIAPHKTAAEMAATPMANLIFYKALGSAGGVHVISNGAQTDPVLDCIVTGNTLGAAVRNAPTIDDVDLSIYEPDVPNNTPRIAGVIDLRERYADTPFGLAVVRKDLETGEPIYSTYEAPAVDDLAPGAGYVIQTYNGNGSPLPSFDQEPYPIPLGYDVVDTAADIWGNLNRENRVSLVVRAIDLSTRQAAGTCIINSQA